MSKNDVLNCYSDLYRASYSLSVNPHGQNHLIFLSHAIKILRIKKFKNELIKIQKKLFKKLKKEEIPYLADKILTTGIILKQKAL